MARVARNPAIELEPSELPKGQARRRQRIVDEAYRLIAARGNENVQIREIAESAGVALGTAYRYFGSKERLVAEVYAKWVEGHTTELARYVDRGKTNRERLRILALHMFDRFTGEPQLLRLARQDLRRTNVTAVSEIINRSDREWMSLFRSALKGVEARDADSITFIISSVVALELDRYLAGDSSMEECKRDILKAVKIVLEFRDPTLAPSGATGGSKRARTATTRR
ncbi:MAG: TetR/AcrR family transcriptional regulator [Acidimicrobiia bacterium]